jgi:hypothetical protein
MFFESASGAMGELVTVGICRYSGRAVEDLRIAAYALAHPRFGTGPTPSLMLISRLARICSKVSCSPLGQYTSMSAEVEFPKPKCKRESLHEKKLD